MAFPHSYMQDDTEGDNLGHDQSMRQPASTIGASLGGPQVVQPPQPMPAQLWQRANAMQTGNASLMGQQSSQQPQALMFQGQERGAFSSSTAGPQSILGQQLASQQQQALGLPQQGFFDRGSTSLDAQQHATDRMFAAMQQQQQQQQQQQPGSSLLNEFYQQRRVPNTMGLQAASASAASSAQAFQSMLGQQQQQAMQQQQQQLQQSSLMGQLGHQTGFGNVPSPQSLMSSQYAGFPASRWMSHPTQPSLAGMTGATEGWSSRSLGAGGDAYSSLAAASIEQQQPSSMLTANAYLLQQAQQQGMMGPSQLQLRLEQQLQQQQYAQQPHQRRRSSSVSSTGSQEQKQRSTPWQQQQQQQQLANLQQQPDFRSALMGGSMPSLYRPTANRSVVQTEHLIKRKVSKRRAKTFPEKLMQAMMDHGNEDAVGWLPDGKSFVIVSPDIFVRDVLNQVFKESKYASFVRKLHRWGFIRLTSGTGTDCFHHPLFQRNRKDLASKITCAKDKSGSPQVVLPKGLRHDKPPSLAGVEKFIRAKAAATAAALKEATAAAGPSLKDDSEARHADEEAKLGAGGDDKGLDSSLPGAASQPVGNNVDATADPEAPMTEGNVAHI